MNYWDSLDPKYRLLLCDVWGVVHDGVNLYPGAEARLRQWRGEGRCVVLLTNAPRTADAVDARPDRPAARCL
jgi:ribonucleotide monophosphatase NagD (HAD superfamily)